MRVLNTHTWYNSKVCCFLIAKKNNNDNDNNNKMMQRTHGADFMFSKKSTSEFNLAPFSFALFKELPRGEKRN